MDAGSESYQQTLAEWAGKGILSSQALRQLQVVKDPEPKDPAKPFFDSWPGETVR